MKYLFFLVALLAAVPVLAQTQAVTVNTSGVVINATPYAPVNFPTGNLQLNGSVVASAINNLSFFAPTTSAQLASIISNETGTNLLVFNTNAVLVTPNLGTPSAVVLTNGTGLPISTGVSGLGTGVATALGNAVNTALGPVTANALGFAAPNVTTAKSGYLLASFQGAFLTGKERGVLLYSADGLTFQQLKGLENFNPPVDVSGNATGIRDLDIIKSNGDYYIVCSSVIGGNASGTVSGGTGNYFFVICSHDLVNWFWVSSVTGTNLVVSPKWFPDPVTGNLYVVSGSYIRQCTALSSTSSTWGSETALTIGGGITIGGNLDSFMVNVGGTYGLFAWPSTAVNTYHIYTSSTLTGSFTDTGSLNTGSSWGNAEGIAVFLNTLGKYTAYMNARSPNSLSNMIYATSTSPLSPSAWSTQANISSSSVAMAQITDNGGGFCVNNLDTFSDILSATLQQNVLLQSRGPNLPNTYTLNPTNTGLTMTPLSTQATGTGTITTSTSSNITTMTGTGTRFTQEIGVGDLVYCPSSGAQLYVLKVSSDTSCQIAKAAVVTNQAWTYNRSPQQWGDNNGVLAFFSGPHATGSFNNPVMWFLTNNNSSQAFYLQNIDTGYAFQFAVGSTGFNIVLPGVGSPFNVSNTAMNNAMQLTSTGASSAGNFSAAAIVPPSGQTIPVGVQSGGSTATPTLLQLDGSFGSSTPGNIANLKLGLYPSADYGLGLSNFLFEFHSQSAFAWYNTGTQEMALSSSGGLTILSTLTSNGGKVLSLAGNLTTSGAFATTLTTTGTTSVTLPTSGTLATTATSSFITVQTGTLVGGTATKTVPAGCHPWVADNASSLTNVGSLTVTVSGTTATITSTNVLDVSPFTLFNAGSQ